MSVEERHERSLYRGDRGFETYRHSESLKVAGQRLDQLKHSAHYAGDSRARRSGIPQLAHGVGERSRVEHRGSQAWCHHIHIELVGMP